MNIDQLNPIVVTTLSALAIVAIGLRILGRVLYPHAIAGDVQFHLGCAKVIRGNNMKIPDSIPGYIWDTGYTYPPLFHYILALFSEKGGMYFERFASVIFDVLQTAMVFYTSDMVLVNLGYEAALAKNMALGVSAAYILSPVFNSHVWGPRVMTGTGRTLGEALFVTALCSSLLWAIGNGSYFALLAIVCFGLLPLASKFGLQVLLAFLIGCAVFLQFKLVLLILLGFCFGLLISGGHLFRVIKGHIGHSIFYFQFLQYRYTGLIKGGFLDFKRYMERFKNALFPQPINIIRWLLNDKSFYHIIVFYNTHLWAVVFLWFRQPIGETLVPHNHVLKTLMIMAVMPFLPVLLTSLRKFRFLGESYRYLEYFQFPFWMLLLLLSAKWFSVFALISAFYSILLIFQAISVIKLWHQDYLRSEGFFEELRKSYKGRRVYSLDGMHHETAFRGNMNVLFFTTNIKPGLVSYDELEEVMGRFPYPSNGRGYLQILKKYAVEYVLCHESTLNHLKPVIFEGLSEVKMPPCHLRLFRVNYESI